MSIASTTNRVDYTGNGAVDTYAYTFRIFAGTDLLVTVRDTNDVETTLTLTTHYTVTGAGDASGGNVALVNGAFAWLDGDGDLKTGFALSIRRSRPLTQETDIRNQGDFFPETHEDAFDHLVMISQQLQDQIDRCVKLRETDYDNETFIPVASERASQYLAFDAAGVPIAAATVGSGVSASAYMQTVLDDATATDARTTLGFSGAAGTVATSNIEDLAVTTGKLAAGAATGSKRLLTISAKTANYTLALTDDLVRCDSSGGTFAITIPAAAAGNAGKTFTIVKSDSSFTAVTTLTGMVTSLNTQGESLTIVSNGSAWSVVSRYVPSVSTSFTMVITGSSVNPTKGYAAGTNNIDSATWRRVGDSVYISYQYAQSSGGSAGTGSYLFALPSGLAIDTTKLVITSPTNCMAVGPCYTSTNSDGLSSSSTIGTMIAANSTQLAMRLTSVDTTTQAIASSTAYALSTAILRYVFTAVVPISGWNG